MTRTTIALAATAALIGGATLGVNAHGQDQPPQTITLQGGPAKQRDINQIDAKPRGTSVGDRFLVAETLRRDGKPVGRMLTECVAVDASYEGRMCSITLVTRDGQITAQGGGVDRPLPGRGGDPENGDVFAITGGIGTYAGATGTLRVRPTRNGDTLTIKLGAGA
jgi:hypothetical protein